jgi:hypothetical protein
MLTYFKAQYQEARYEWKAHGEYLPHHIHQSSMLVCSHTSTVLSIGLWSLSASSNPRKRLIRLIKYLCKHIPYHIYEL